MEITERLRREGKYAECDIVGRSLKAQMKYANKLGTKYLVVLGSNELEQGKGQIKNMETGNPFDIRLDSAANFAEDYSGISLAEMFGGETE